MTPVTFFSVAFIHLSFTIEPTMSIYPIARELSSHLVLTPGKKVESTSRMTVDAGESCSQGQLKTMWRILGQ